MSMELVDRLGGVDRQSGVAVYHQIAEQLGALIEDGTIDFGEKLPSETALVEHYGVARMTVRQALTDLRDSGHVRSEQGRGVFAILRHGAQNEVPLPGVFNDPSGGRLVVRTITLDHAEVYRFRGGVGGEPDEMTLVGEIRDWPDPSDFWPHYSWRIVGADDWRDHDLDIRDWREAATRLAAAQA